MQDDLVDVSLWGHVEASVCVILACIPRISVFFMRLYRKHSLCKADNLRSGASDTHWNGDALVRFDGPKGWPPHLNPGMSDVEKPYMLDESQFGRDFARKQLYSADDQR